MARDDAHVTTVFARLRTYSLWIAILVALLLATILLLALGRLDLEDTLVQVGVGLAASAVFAALWTTVANAESDRFLTAQFEANFQRQNDQLLAGVRELSARYIPERVYTPTNSYSGNDFNADLMTSIRESRTYTFQGASGKYVSARIRAAGGRLTRVRALVLNPEASVAVAARAADRHRNPRYEGLTVQQIRDLVRQETCRSVVALFGCAQHVRIEIGLSSNYPAVQRVELTDNASFVSVYGSEARMTEFPIAYRYGSTSLAYQVQSLEAERLYEFSEKQIVLTRQTTNDELLAILRGIGMRDVDQAAVDAMSREAREFEDRFLAAIGESA